MLSRLAMPIIIGLIMWLGYTFYWLIQEDKCLDTGGSWQKQSRTCTGHPPKRLSSYYHEQIPYR